MAVTITGKGLTVEDIKLQLRTGSPRIDVFSRNDCIVVSPLTLQPGEEQIVATRLREIINAAGIPK